MTTVLARQTAFNRGELDQTLYGRMDWQSYYSGARRVRNMICRPTGGVLKRPGTEFVEEALRQDGPSRLIKFQFNVEQSYLLEFGGRGFVNGALTDVFRVFKDGGLIYKNGAPALFPSFYSAEDVERVCVCQMEDRMVFTHPSHPPRTLTRFDHDDWRWEDIVFGSSVAAPYLTLTADGKNEVGYVVTALTSGGEESLPSNSVTTSKPPTNPTLISLPRPVEQMEYLDVRDFLIYYGQTVEPDFVKMTARQLIDYLKSLGYTSTAKGEYWDSPYWKWRHNNPRTGANTTELWWTSNNFDQLINECIACANAAFRNTVLADLRAQLEQYVADHNAANTVTGVNGLSWTAVDGAARYRVYRTARQSDGALRYLGITEITGLAHTDDNGPFMSPAVSPPAGYNEGGDGVESPFSGPGNYPGVCAFFQQRLILARTNNQPCTLWGSAVGTYKNFYRSESSDTAAWEFTLWASEVNEILWMVALEDLLIGTAGGEWRMSGGSYIITATNVNVSRQSNYGCSFVPPIIVGQAVMAVGRKGKALRTFQYDEADRYDGKHVSHYAEHLFQDRRIGGIAYQFEPAYLLWTVMSDGALLSLTYMNEEDVLGWARHDTDGAFEAVAHMISVEGEDEIWFQTARRVGNQTRRYIERLKDVQYAGEDVADAWYVDCGLARDGALTATLGGLDHLEGKTVVCLGDGNVYADLVVTGGYVTLPVEVRKAVVGLPFAAELETLELEPSEGGSIGQAYKNPTVASVLFYNSRECEYGSPDYPIPVKQLYPAGTHLIPETKRVNVAVPPPREGDNASLWFRSRSPVPFGILSMAVEFSVGETMPRQGKAMGVS